MPERRRSGCSLDAADWEEDASAAGGRRPSVVAAGLFAGGRCVERVPSEGVFALPFAHEGEAAVLAHGNSGSRPHNAATPDEVAYLLSAGADPGVFLPQWTAADDPRGAAFAIARQFSRTNCLAALERHTP